MLDLEEQILAEVRKFADKELKPIANKRFHSCLNAEVVQNICSEKEIQELKKFENKYAEVPVEVVNTMKEMGLFGLIIPEKYGGLGLRYTIMSQVTEILSSAWLAAGSIATRNQITSTALLKNGTEKQKNGWLPKLASGEMMTAIAVTEPDYGSDILNLRTKAERDGNSFILNGTKMWCTYAHRANYLTVLARTGGEGAKGLSLFLVEKPSSEFIEGQGISGNYIHTIAYHGIPSFEIVFENCKVPLENLVGEEDGLGKGLYATLKGFQEGRLQTAARSVGVAQAAFDAAFQYAHGRKQFGNPIADFQAIQHMLADMYTDIQAAKALTYRACDAMDKNSGEAEILCYASKLHATQMVDRVTRSAMEIHGGYGIAQEHDVSRSRLDAQVLDLFEGTPQVQRNMVYNKLNDLLK